MDIKAYDHSFLEIILLKKISNYKLIHYKINYLEDGLQEIHTLGFFVNPLLDCISV
jgi:hypothetical protein